MTNNWNFCGWRTVETPSNVASVAMSMAKGIVDIARQLAEATKTEPLDALTNGSKKGSTGRDPKAKAINGKESNKGNACNLDRRARTAAVAARPNHINPLMRLVRDAARMRNNAVYANRAENSSV